MRFRIVPLLLLTLLIGVALGATSIWAWQQHDTIPPSTGAPGVPAPFRGSSTMIPTADLPLGDFVHLTVDGYREAGRRVAVAADNLSAAGCARP